MDGYTGAGVVQGYTDLEVLLLYIGTGTVKA
jgi:hypothetical protein